MKTKILIARGSTLLEAALMLPLFLLGMYVVLWISTIVNTKTSLISAVENGVRQAATRGKAGLFEGQSIGADLDEEIYGQLKPLDYYWSTKQNSKLGVLKELLEFNISGTTFETVYSSYVVKIFSPIENDLKKHRPSGASGPLALNDLPPYYMYAIAYINKAMRMAVGDGIRYPCDPNDPADPQKGENCLLCRPINPKTMDDEQFYPENDTDRSMLLTRVAIRCDYKPSGLIVRPLLEMLGLLGGSDASKSQNGVMSHYTYFDSFEECMILRGRVEENEVARYCCRDYRLNNNYYCF